MSLLISSFEPFVYMDARRERDEYGGIHTVWSEGAEFDAASVYETSIEARVAAVQGVTNLYTITTSRSINLQYHDVIKRLCDGKIFRITSDGDDKKTPAPASLDMRQVTAEEWTLPS